MRHACRIDDRCRIDSRHPNADLVLLEQVGNELVEVDIGLGIVEVGELVVIARVC